MYLELFSESQLAESESSKAQVEMTLTERLARPISQTEVHYTFRYHFIS